MWESCDCNKEYFDLRLLIEGDCEEFCCTSRVECEMV